jgi:predicted N-formylglutamate amidohydrolase
MPLKRPILIIVDHASNFIPHKYKNLGLSKGLLKSHIAYDIDIRESAYILSQYLKSHLICGEYSRLMIDLNRGLKDPTLITTISDKKIIPGNIKIDPEDKKFRINKIYRKYHSHIKSTICKNDIKLIVSLHSFNPIYKNKKRNIEIGILSNNDKRYSSKLIHNLKMKNYILGDNEPYYGDLRGDSLNRHGLKNNLLHVLIELRNDLINTRVKRQKICKFISKNITKTNKFFF